MKIYVEPFEIGDMVKYIYYDWEDTHAHGSLPIGAERGSIAFIVDIIEDPDEKQVDMFPKVLIYDTRSQRTVLTHSYNIEIISRSA